MAVDFTLTRERALEEIGELLPHNYSDQRPLRNHYRGIERTFVPEVMDTSMTISEESGIMQRMKRWRQSQVGHGFLADEAFQAYDKFAAATNIGIFNDAEYWEEEQGWLEFGLFYEGEEIFAPSARKEVLYNALEHGSKFGAQGSVKVRVRGGSAGALIEVTDPGRGRMTVPLTVEQIVERYERAGIRLQTPPTSYADFVHPKLTEDTSRFPQARGMGSTVITIAKAVVSEHTSDQGYTVLLLYKPQLLPGYWKKELLKPEQGLAEAQRRLLSSPSP